MKNQKYWTNHEDQIMREHYPLGGTKRVREFLPHRGKGSISSRATFLGLHVTGRKQRGAAPEATEWMDAAIRRVYQQGAVRGKVRTLAKQLGVTHGWIVWRAQELGLSRQMPGSSGSPWIPAEDAILADRLDEGKSITSIQRYLRKAGYARSLNSIANRVQIAGLTWQNPDWSAQDVARALGMSGATILKWLATGKLKGTQKRGPSVDYKQDAALMRWHVRPHDVRAFMLAHPRDWDARKMQQEVLIDLLAGDERGFNSGGLSVSAARELAG